MQYKVVRLCSLQWQIFHYCQINLPAKTFAYRSLNDSHRNLVSFVFHVQPNSSPDTESRSSIELKEELKKKEEV